MCILCRLFCVFFFQAEDGIRDLVRSRGLGDVYKRQEVLVQAIGAMSTGCMHDIIQGLLKEFHAAASVLHLSLIHI